MKKSSLFCVRLLQVTFCVTFSLNATHQSFNLWIAHYPVEICLERTDFRGQQFMKLSWQPCCVYVTFHPTQSWWEEEKPATDLASVNKVFLASSYKSALLSSILSFRNLDHVWLKAVVFSYSIYNVCNDVTYYTSLFIVVAFAWQI